MWKSAGPRRTGIPEGDHQRRSDDHGTGQIPAARVVRMHLLVKVHFAKEEEVYLPILDERLTPESAQGMFEAMEESAHKVKYVAH